MPLSDSAVRNAKPKDKPYRLADGQGLCLEVRPAGPRKEKGSKLWRYRYRLGGKENMFAIGEYPEVSLLEAREALREARKLVKQGLNPSHVQERQRLENLNARDHTFKAIAEEWIDKHGKKWTERNRNRLVRTLTSEVFPDIGKLPIRQVTPAHLLKIMQRIDERGGPTIAILIRQWCDRIFNHAIATLRLDVNPATSLRRAIQVPKTQSNRNLEEADIRPLVIAVDGYGGERKTAIALKLLLLTFVRSIELRGAEWKEFDFEGAKWTIPASRMKMRDSHVVPLSVQVIALLQELQTLTGWSRYLFPNSRTANIFMGNTTLNAALTRLGYKDKFSPHGFRSTASTLLHGAGFRSEWIERQLSHKDRNAVKAIYNRADYLAERSQMMQQWADMIDAFTAEKRKLVTGKFGKVA